MLNKLAFVSLSLVLGACVGGSTLWQGNTMQPTFDARAHQPVLTQSRTTGTVAPTYFHEDLLVLDGDGSWHATRTYPYAGGVPQPLGSGVLDAEHVQQLVNLAFASPEAGQQRFVELPETVDSKLVGSGKRNITLSLKSGTHSVTVMGQAPPAFERLDQAIASATIPLGP